eukprot:SAG31_NODE_13101_length_892_cov_1.414880_1_plen_44_part_00
MYYWDSGLLEANYGVRVDTVPRLEQGSAIVVREWTKATVRCNE